MMKSGATALAGALAFWAGSALGASAFETRIAEIVHDGLERRAILDAAPGLRDAPLLIVLHGGIAGPDWMRRRSRTTLASRGWAVAWPYAVDDWNDGRIDSEGRPFDEADDVGFLRALIADLAERGTVDPDRVFVAGPSIGGMMTLRMICDAPELFAGAAIAIASRPTGLACAADGPAIPTLFLHGRADGIVPEEGGRIGGDSLFIRDRGRVAPVAETMALLAARNRCDGFMETDLPDHATDDGSTVALREYRNCAEPLLHYVIEGGGHGWPGSPAPRMAGFFIGETNQDISATRVVESFFSSIAARRAAGGLPAAMRRLACMRMSDEKPSLQSAYALNAPEDSVRLYRDWAATYEDAFAEERDYVYPRRVAELYAREGALGLPVLDVGAGTGLVGRALRSLAVETVDGLDISAEMLAQAARKGGYRRLIEADLTKPLGLAAGAYGGVVSAGTFTHGHVGPDAIAQLASLASAGGLLALGVNAAHFRAEGFDAAFGALAEAGAIAEPRFVEVEIYGARAQHEHRDDRALVALLTRL